MPVKMSKYFCGQNKRHVVLHIRNRVQKFPAWHTKAAPNGKCCEGYVVPSMVRLMYQFQACWNKGRLCWKIAKVFYFCHLKELVRPETFGPYYVHSLLWCTRSTDFVVEHLKRRELTCSKHMKWEDMRSDLGEMRHEDVTRSEMVRYGVHWSLLLTANIVEASVCMS